MKCDCMRVSRGQVFYYSVLWSIFGKNDVPVDLNLRGSIERKIRPFLVFSTDEGNRSSPTCNLLPITRRNRTVIPGQVMFNFNGSSQVILTEQPVTANISDLGNYLFTVGDDIMRSLDDGLAVQFGIKGGSLVKRIDDVQESIVMIANLLNQTKNEKETYFYQKKVLKSFASMIGYPIVTSTDHSLLDLSIFQDSFLGELQSMVLCEKAYI